MQTPLVTVTVLVAFGFVLLAEDTKPRPAVFTAAQSAAGKSAYRNACAKCHTEALTGRDGTGEIPEFLRDYKGKIPPLAGANAAFPPFLEKWGANTTTDLVTRIKSAAGAFRPADRRQDDELFLDLTAYILEVNGAKPGPEALTTTRATEIRKVTPGQNATH